MGGLLLAVLAFCIALSRSSFGRILQGIRENEQRAELLGFDIRWRKTAIFTLAGAIAGLAGGLFAAWAISSILRSSACRRPRSWSSGCWSAGAARCMAPCSARWRYNLPAILGPRVSTYTTLLLGTALLVIGLFFKEGLAPALWRPIQRAVLNRRPSASS